ncbi:Bromodomain-containing protein [Clavulina sp. PMI_390]|nr:Bromodomain-containing protein [Clavulina sp. PMI_390]
MPQGELHYLLMIAFRSDQLNRLRYFEKIKHPMDLSTMGYKLDNGHYTSREAFARDVDLIIANARAYNPPGTMLITETDKFQAFYERSTLLFT